MLCILAVVCQSAIAGVNWPQFRGPNGDGISDETGLPVTWSEAENVVWKTAVDGRAWASPVIWKDQIWLANATEDGEKLSAVCIDRTTGKVVHDVLVFTIAEPQFCYSLNSYASCTPAIEEGRIYLHYGAHGTACLDTATGKTLWARQDLPCNHFRGPASSPIIHGNLVVVAYDGFDLQYVVALDKHTGNTVWRKDRNIEYGTDNGDMKKGFGTGKVIEVEGKPQLIYPSAGATIAYQPENGDELWRVNHGGMNACNPPIYQDGLLFLNTAAGGFRLFAMKVDGTGDITKKAVVWKNDKGVPTRSSTLIKDGLIYMVSDAGVATCLDAKDAKLVWQKRFSGEFSSSPVYVDGKIYFSNQEGESFVIAAGREYELLATNKLDDGCMASPAIYEKALYLRTKTHLYRLEKPREAQSPGRAGG